MEGAHLDPVDSEHAKAIAHLPRGTRGEGHGESATRIMGTGVDGMGDAMGHGSRLAAARPGPHHDRALQGLGDGALLGVERLEGIHHCGIVASGTDVAGRGRPGEDVPVTTIAPLIMYTTVWCGFCQRLKAQLAREGIEVTEVDIEADPAAATFVENVNGGNQTVPTLVFADGSAMTNPTLAQVRAKLGL